MGRAVGHIAEDYVRSLRVTLLLPAIAYVVLRWRARRQVPQNRAPATPSRDALRVVGAAASLHVLILLGLILGFDYLDLFSMRHVLVLAGLTLPFSAAGVAGLVDLVPAGQRRLASITLPVVLIAATAPWMFQKRNGDSGYLRLAGEWIRTENVLHPRVLTTRHRIAFYANGRQVWSPDDADLEGNLAIARAEKPDYLAFDLRRIPVLAELAPDDRAEALTDMLNSLARPGERIELHRVVFTDREDGRDQAVIFRYHPPPG